MPTVLELKSVLKKLGYTEKDLKNKRKSELEEMLSKAESGFLDIEQSEKDKEDVIKEEREVEEKLLFSREVKLRIAERYTIPRLGRARNIHIKNLGVGDLKVFFNGNQSITLSPGEELEGADIVSVKSLSRPTVSIKVFA